MKTDNSATASLAETKAYWEHKAATETDDCSRIESGRRGQRMRFENFILHHDLLGASVLDVGCGVGDFYEHLNRRNLSTKYLGVDIAEAMILRSKARFPGARFELRDIMNWQPEEQFDYTIAFAIHNVKMPSGRELLEQVTRRQFELCARAAHIDLLTDRFSGFDPHIQAWRVEEVIALALKITPYVVMRNDYLPNSFSITLYRQPMIDTRGGLLLD